MPNDILQNIADCDIRMLNSGTDMDPVFDIGWGESTEQHQRDLVLGHKGEIPFSPSFGVGASLFLDDERPDEFINEIRRQSARDGMKIRVLRWPAFPNGNIQYYVNY